MKCFVRGLLFLIATSPAIFAQPPATPNGTPASKFSDAASQPIFPPLVPWNGKSRSLAVVKNDPWITPSEKTDFRATPSYDETMAWLHRLVAAAPPRRASVTSVLCLGR